MKSLLMLLLFGLLLTGAPSAAPAETVDDWIALGARVHGGFGSHLILGIRIGQDAMRRLEAEPGSLDVTYRDGPKTPCGCVADGIMLATRATPGRHTLRVLPEKSGAGTLAVAIIRNVKTGKALRYIVPASNHGRLEEWNRDKSERDRYAAVMGAPADSLFRVQALDESEEKRAPASL